MKQLLLFVAVLCVLFATATGTSHFCDAGQSVGDDCSHKDGIIEVCEQQTEGLACVANTELCSSKAKGEDCSTASRPNMKCACPKGNSDCSELICAPDRTATKVTKKVTKKAANKAKKKATKKKVTRRR